MKKAPLGAALLALVLNSVAMAVVIPTYVTQAVADGSRPKADSVRDALRLPAETIAFAGVKPGMRVAEFFPGGGYFTRQLSDVVGKRGHIYAIENAKWDDGSDAKVVASVKDHNISLQMVRFGEFTLPRKVDLVWISQNYHDLHIAQYGSVDMAAFNRHLYSSLRRRLRVKRTGSP